MIITKTKTRKGEKYVISDDRFVLTAYHYSWHTRYFIKHPDETRFRQEKAEVLWSVCPAMFRELRAEIGLRRYFRT